MVQLCGLRLPRSIRNLLGDPYGVSCGEDLPEHLRMDTEDVTRGAAFLAQEHRTRSTSAPEAQGQAPSIPVRAPSPPGEELRGGRQPHADGNAHPQLTFHGSPGAIALFAFDLHPTWHISRSGLFTPDSGETSTFQRRMVWYCFHSDHPGELSPPSCLP